MDHFLKALTQIVRCVRCAADIEAYDVTYQQLAKEFNVSDAGTIGWTNENLKRFHALARRLLRAPRGSAVHCPAFWQCTRLCVRAAHFPKAKLGQPLAGVSEGTATEFGIGERG